LFYIFYDKDIVFNDLDYDYMPLNNESFIKDLEERKKKLEETIAKVNSFFSFSSLTHSHLLTLSSSQSFILLIQFKKYKYVIGFPYLIPNLYSLF
jgi:hypothetical protein